MRFTVRGTPVPQGSIRSLGKGRPSVHANAAALLPWRGHVQIEAERALGGRAPLEGPVEVSLAFYVARPRSAPKRIIWPTKRPDIDKTSRAVLDALTAAGVWLDDSQVVSLHASKAFAGNGHLDVPGVVIHVEPLERDGAA